LIPESKRVATLWFGGIMPSSKRVVNRRTGAPMKQSIGKPEGWRNSEKYVAGTSEQYSGGFICSINCYHEKSVAEATAPKRSAILDFEVHGRTRWSSVLYPRSVSLVCGWKYPIKKGGSADSGDRRAGRSVRMDVRPGRWPHRGPAPAGAGPRGDLGSWAQRRESSFRSNRGHRGS